MPVGVGLLRKTYPQAALQWQETSLVINACKSYFVPITPRQPHGLIPQTSMPSQRRMQVQPAALHQRKNVILRPGPLRNASARSSKKQPATKRSRRCKPQIVARGKKYPKRQRHDRPNKKARHQFSRTSAGRHPRKQADSDPAGKCRRHRHHRQSHGTNLMTIVAAAPASRYEMSAETNQTSQWTQFRKTVLQRVFPPVSWCSQLAPPNPGPR